MSTDKTQGPFFAVTKLITDKLRDRAFTKANKTTCIEIYQLIFETLVEVFEKSGADKILQNEAMNYTAQQIYSGVLLNNSEELDPNIFDKLATVKNISTKELAFLVLFFNNTDFRYPIIEEIKLRS